MSRVKRGIVVSAAVVSALIRLILLELAAAYGLVMLYEVKKCEDTLLTITSAELTEEELTVTLENKNSLMYFGALETNILVCTGRNRKTETLCFPLVQNAYYEHLITEGEERYMFFSVIPPGGSLVQHFQLSEEQRQQFSALREEQSVVYLCADGWDYPYWIPFYMMKLE